MNAVENFRMNVRRICDERFITYEQIAERAGIHAVSVCRILTGARSPSLETSAAIAAAISVPLGELIAPTPDGSKPMKKILARSA